MDKETNLSGNKTWNNYEKEEKTKRNMERDTFPSRLINFLLSF